jgi:signal transduction histidine kinase
MTVRMSALLRVLDLVNLALYTAVALVAVYQWRKGRGPAALWAALTFGALALVVDIAPLLPEDPSGFWEELGLRAILVGLVLFPYFLFRFASAFERHEGRLARRLGLVTGAMVVWTLALPHVPGANESWPVYFVAYVVAFTLHWTALATAVAVRLWRARHGQPTVARRRMQLLAGAAIGIALALVLAATNPKDDGVLDLVVSLLTGLSALAFLVGLAPPPLLRAVWRRPEVERSQAVIARLMSATAEADIAHEVLPVIAGLVGARGAALYDGRGRLIGDFEEEGARAGDSEPLRLDIPSGTLEVRPSPYSPYFGADEMGVLRTLGALTGLALDRARLFATERDARTALERADELKSRFVSLAAHELRTPVATIDGIVQTLHLRGEELGDDALYQLRAALRQQTARLGALVEQLLDLSRLDADAVTIEPHEFAVRGRVEELLATAAPDPPVVLDIDGDLLAVADTAAFDRIVTNLVTNALRYGAPPVTVHAEQRDRHFRLAVEDRGPGVPPEFVPSLFERFSRSRSTRDTQRGTGLGLAIARSYAQAHGGELLYTPAEPTGARFELVLPRGLTPPEN